MGRWAFGLLVLVSSAARAQLITWSPSSFISGDPVRAVVTGGPWTLGTDGGYPTPNTGTSNFEPDYQPQVLADSSGNLFGYFDYRPENLEEGTLAASSPDGVRWTFDSLALDFAGVSSDSGEGHPFTLTIGGQTYLYTLDRTTGAIDSAGLVVHAISPTSANPLAGAPATELPVPPPGTAGSLRTSGLLNPDGIIGVVPGSSPLQILYGQKILGADGGADAVTIRRATTADGLSFTDQGAVSGLQDPCIADPSTCVTSQSVTYVASRGTLFQITDLNGVAQGYGLLFSVGLWGEDSDSYHYVAYAESTDLTSWTTYNGLGGAPSLPLISIDGKDLTPSGQASKGPLAFYATRAYAPSAVPDVTGCASLNLIFSGYSGSAKKTNDYRQVGQVTLDLSESGHCVVVAQSGAAQVTPPTSSGTTGGATGTSGGATGTTGGVVATTGSTTGAGVASAGSSSTSGASSASSSTASSGTSGSSSGGSTVTATSGSTSGSHSSSSTSGATGGAQVAIPKGSQSPGPGCSTGGGDFAAAALIALFLVGRRHGVRRYQT